MSELIEAIRARMPADRCCLIGVSGAVAVGKTTIATQIAVATRAGVISTDAFLLPNTVLGERQILMRKGFPESYDTDALSDALDALQNGESVSIPVYSHDVYDILPGEHVDVGGEVIVLEGVTALQEPARSVLDIAVYVDAPDEVVREWFVVRFLRWTAAAKDDPSSFYHGFSTLEPDAVRGIAEMTWDGINAVNLADHIAPTKATADIVVTKGPDHAIVDVSVR